MVLIWSAAGLPFLLNSSTVTFLAAGADSAATHTRATSALAILPALPLSPWAARDTSLLQQHQALKIWQRLAQYRLRSSLTKPVNHDCARAWSREVGIRRNGLCGVPHLQLGSSVLEGHWSGHLPFTRQHQSVCWSLAHGEGIRSATTGDQETEHTSDSSQTPCIPGRTTVYWTLPSRSRFSPLNLASIRPQRMLFSINLIGWNLHRALGRRCH